MWLSEAIGENLGYPEPLTNIGAIVRAFAGEPAAPRDAFRPGSKSYSYVTDRMVKAAGANPATNKPYSRRTMQRYITPHGEQRRREKTLKPGVPVFDKLAQAAVKSRYTYYRENGLRVKLYSGWLCISGDERLRTISAPVQLEEPLLTRFLDAWARGETEHIGEGVDAFEEAYLDAYLEGGSGVLGRCDGIRREDDVTALDIYQGIVHAA